MQRTEPKTCVPFTSQPEFPQFLGKWKTPVMTPIPAQVRVTRERVIINYYLNASGIGLQAAVEKFKRVIRLRMGNKIPSIMKTKKTLNLTFIQ